MRKKGNTKEKKAPPLDDRYIVVEKYTLLREERSLSPKMMSVVYACTPERREGGCDAYIESYEQVFALRRAAAAGKNAT